MDHLILFIMKRTNALKMPTQEKSITKQALVGKLGQSL